MARSCGGGVSVSELMYMREHENMSNSAIAKSLDMSYQTVLNLIGRQPRGIRKCSVGTAVKKSAPTKKDVIITRLREHLQAYKAGYDNEWIGIFLQGSQNYNLDYEGSDIDSKIIVLPSFEDVVLNRKPISTTLVLPNDEHCDIKDIRLMFECFKKQNINFLEILFSEYQILNPAYANLFAPLLERREAVAHYNNYAFMSCAAGMIVEKYKALEKDHPSAQEIIGKYGYDGKQLHHIERIFEFMKRFLLGNEPFSDCLLSNQRDYLISLKRCVLPKERAEQVAEYVLNQALAIRDSYMKETELHIDQSVDTLLENILKDVLKRSFSTEFRKTEVKVL